MSNITSINIFKVTSVFITSIIVIKCYIMFLTRACLVVFTPLDNVKPPHTTTTTTTNNNNDNHT